jgi:hypothetical protein
MFVLPHGNEKGDFIIFNLKGRIHRDVFERKNAAICTIFSLSGFVSKGLP